MTADHLPEEPRILIVDDDAVSVRLLAHVLTGLARIQVTTKASEALDLVLSGKPDLVLLDIEMPDLDGFALCERIRQQPGGKQTQVLFVTSHGEEALEVRALAAGAIDFIHKPVRREIVRSRVSNYLALKRQTDELRRLSMEDGLTGVANRRAFDRLLDQEYAHASRTGDSLALLICDADHFKAYNDTYGHVAGDACLQEIAAILRAHARRADDVVARYGGEEFAVILPRCSLSEAQAIGTSMLEAIRDRQIAHAGSLTASCVTMSIGVNAVVPSGRSAADRRPAGAPDGHTPKTGVLTFIQQADDALYRAKQAGRNRMASQGEQRPQGRSPATCSSAPSAE